MNYFETAEEMAEKLDLELLHRANADSRAVIRHDRLAAYATDPVQSGYAWARVREELRRQGAEVETLWLACPYGGMEQLPWAVGFAEQLARGGEPVYIAGPEVPSLLPAHPGARSRELPRNLRRRLKDLLSKGAVAVTTDLEGVRIVAPHEPPMPTAGEAETSAHPVLLWVQSLPEELGTRLPFPDTFDGVVFVASFRDHTPFELEACARQLRTAGQRLLGVIAIGPDGSEPSVELREPSGTSVRPSSIWDDSLPAARPSASSGASPSGGKGDGRSGTHTSPMAEMSGSSNPRERGPFGFPKTRAAREAESGAAGMVTATSWAHLASGGRGTDRPAGAGRHAGAAGHAASGPSGRSQSGPPTPDPEAKRLLDRLGGAKPKSKSATPDPDPDTDPNRSGHWPDPEAPVHITLVEADSGPSLAPVAPKGRQTPLSFAGAPTKGASEADASPSRAADSQAGWAAGLADTIEATKEDGAPGRKKKRNRKRKRAGDAHGGAPDKAAAGAARETAAREPREVPAAERQHAAADADGRPRAAAAGPQRKERAERRADVPNGTSRRDESGPGRAGGGAPGVVRVSAGQDGSGAREESRGTAAVREGEMTEARTVPLIGLWEREHRRGTTPKRAAKMAFWTILACLGAGAAYWFGTGHTLEQLKELFLGGSESTAASIARPGPGTNETDAGTPPRVEAGFGSVTGGSPSVAAGDAVVGVDDAVVGAGGGAGDAGDAVARVDDAAEATGAAGDGPPAAAPNAGDTSADGSGASDRSPAAADRSSAQGPLVTPPRTAWTDVGSASDYARGRAGKDPSDAAHVPAGSPGAEAARGRGGMSSAEQPAGRTEPALLSPSPGGTESTLSAPASGGVESSLPALAREDVEAALDTPGSNRSGSGPGTSTAPDAGAAPGTSATPGTDVLPGAGATLDTAPSDRGTTPSAGPVAGAAEASAGALTPPASPPDESTAWVVHLASFRELEDANVDIGRLRGKGIEARAVYVEVPERGPWYRVVAGSFASFVEARQRSLQLSRQLGLDQVHVISGGGQDVPVPIPIPKAGDAKARDGAGTDGSNAGGKDDSAPGDGSQPEVRDGDR